MVLAASLVLQAQHILKMGIADNLSIQAGQKISNSAKNIAGIMFGEPYSDLRFRTQVPYLFLEYQYPVSEVVKIGAQAGYSKFTKSLIYPPSSSGSAEVVDAAQYSYFLVMPAVEVRYHQRGNTTVYGHYMLGLASVAEINGDYRTQNMGLAFQLNPIGISYGNKLAFIGDLGFGLSIFTAGLKYTL